MTSEKERLEMKIRTLAVGGEMVAREVGQTPPTP
mgnify:CR=1 FL=1